MNPSWSRSKVSNTSSERQRQGHLKEASLFRRQRKIWEAKVQLSLNHCKMWIFILIRSSLDKFKMTARWG
jgi:hypothetical protein